MQKNETDRLVSELFLGFIKALYEVKAKPVADWCQYISIALNLAYNKNKLYKTLDY